MKTEPTENVAAVKKGELDSSGNQITQVLSNGNEYVIYEIEDEDINNRLRVFIDGHTDESETIIVQRYINVKQNYIKAKGMLYRSANFGMMKNRVAHALSSALSSDQENSNDVFENLIQEINDEYSASIKNRFMYVLPFFFSIILMSTIIYCVYPEWHENNNELWSIVCVLIGSAFGATISILFRLKDYNFEEHLNKGYYLLTGIERLFLAFVTATVAYIGIKSGILFSNMDPENYWTLTAIAVVAGFSEAFIPSFLNKMSTEE